MPEKQHVRPGDTVAIIGSYSEAACHTRIAGRRVIVALAEHRAGSLHVPPGSPEGFGLTLGEIGFGNDEAGWFVPAERVPTQPPLEEMLASHRGLIVMGPLTYTGRISVGETTLYVDGKVVEKAQQTIIHAVADAPQFWRLKFLEPDGTPNGSSNSGGAGWCAVGSLRERLIHIHGVQHHQIGVYLAEGMAW